MTANLTNSGEQVLTGKDGIIIVEKFETIRGGRTLNVTGFAPEIISAGHVIIRNTANGELKPMPVTGNAYDALPASHVYVGVLTATIRKARPFASILVRGTVNPTASAYPIGPIQTAFTTAVPHIIFRAD